MSIVPTLKRWKQADAWGSLAGHPSQLCELQVSKRTLACSKEKKVGVGGSTQTCSLVSTRVCVGPRRLPDFFQQVLISCGHKLKDSVSVMMTEAMYV